MKKKKTLSMIFWGAVLILGCVIPFKIFDFIDSKLHQSIKRHAKYTIATTTETDGRGRGLSIHYVYKINNQTYRCSIKYAKGVKAPNGCYYVRFDSTAVYNCEFLQDRPVPDSITEAPTNGWTEIPK